jgi:hypothetical protein
MTRQDKNKTAPDEVAEPHTEVPRSGAGAGTALSAMLRKRQMRATRDTEADAQPPATSARNPPTE